MQPVAYRFAPRPIRVLQRIGWNVTVEDEVRGDEIMLAADREPLRRARPAGIAMQRKELFGDHGRYQPREDIVDGYTVVHVFERDTTTYRLTHLADGRVSDLVIGRHLGYIVTNAIAIRGDCALCVPESNDTVEAFDVATGKRRWKARLANVASVGFLGELPAACDDRGHLVVFDRKRGSVTLRHKLPTRGVPVLHSGASGVFVHHDRGLLFVDTAGVRVLLDELVAEPGCAVAGDSWCRWDEERKRIVFGVVGTQPRVLVLETPAVEVWMDPRGLAWSRRDEVVFAPLATLAHDREVRARCVRIRDPRPPRWEPATVFMASKSFTIIKDRWGRHTLGWKDTGWSKDEAFEVADFEYEFAGAEHADRIGHPTRLRRLGVETELDPGGAPLAPVPHELVVGTVGAFDASEHEVPSTIRALLELGLVTRCAEIDRLIARGTDNAAIALQHVHGARDGIAKGVVSYDHKFLNDTDDPVADFVKLAGHPDIRARTKKIGSEHIQFELIVRGKTQSHRLSIDEQLLDTLRELFNRALEAVSAPRRIYDVYSGADFYTFLACELEVARALRRANVELGDAT